MNERTRQRVRARAERRCEYCRLPDFADELPFHVEHVIAKQHGGRDDLDNLSWACMRCNLRKGPNLASIDPATGELTELYHPRRHRWVEHFRLGHSHIVGLTSIGRCTVRLFAMNDTRRVELRRTLIAEGVFRE